VEPWDIFAVALLTLLGFVLGGGVSMVLLVRRRLRARRRLLKLKVGQEEMAQEFSRYTLVPFNPLQARRPSRWLAIRSRDTQAVQLALRLNNPRPCSWVEGVLVSRQLFIAPPFTDGPWYLARACRFRMMTWMRVIGSCAS
jgi:hypothetical protein